MGKKYRFYDQNQTLILPLNIREWLPKGHLALFISDVVDEMDLTLIFAYYEGEERGSPPYDPCMMAKILFYAYCIGVSSSRKIAKKISDSDIWQQGTFLISELSVISGRYILTP